MFKSKRTWPDTSHEGQNAYNGLALVFSLTPHMLRNVFIVLVLAALAATSAAASPVVPGNAHRLASGTARHKSLRHAATQPAAHRTAGRSASRQHPDRERQSGSLRHRRGAGSAGMRGARVRSDAVSAPVRASLRPVVRQVSLRRDRFVVPPPLKGSFESLARQNERAEADGLERILDEDDLTSRIQQKLLVPIPASGALTVNSDLPETHKYCRPWTANFLGDLAQAHAGQFRKPIVVTSAVRTVEYQQHLMRTNGNAAAAEGDVVSPHMTGGTIDIAKQGMSRQELGWMRNWLLAQQLAGTIDVEEEFRQPCFHITVYKNYTSPPPAPPVYQAHRQRNATASQVASTGK